MSRPEAIRVDRQTGLVNWEERHATRHAFVEGAVDARYDPESDRLLVLTRMFEGGAVAIVSRHGALLATVLAPAGYSLSHFADSEKPVLVGQGEAAVDGWQDWHFAVDEDGRSMRRLGPAY